MEGDRELVFHGIMLNQDTGEGLDRSLFHVHGKYIDNTGPMQISRLFTGSM